MSERTSIRPGRDELSQLDASASVWILMTVNGSFQVHQIPVGTDLVFGRGEGVDVQIEDSQVSRRHLRLTRTDRGLVVRDLDSSNGTFVQGMEIEHATELRAGAEIHFGNTRLWVHVGIDELQAPVAHPHHEWLMLQLDRELMRARAFDRSVGFVLIEAEAATDAFLTTTLGRLREMAREVDVVALHSPRFAEVVLPEATAVSLESLCTRLVRERTPGEPRLKVYGRVSRGRMRASMILDEAMSRLRTVGFSADAPILVTDSVATMLEGPSAAPIAESAEMRELLRQARQIAASDLPVLIHGETGVGKEVVARSIKQFSRRAAGPLVVVNCGAIPATLLEATLFGSVAGAFTGAEEARQGLFQAADQGILFLDEVGELTPAAQAALLRCIATKRVRPVGATSEVEVDLRVVAATHRDLPAMVERGEFRQDLLYRLDGFRLSVPPLRDRRDDLMPLARHFLDVARGAIEMGAEFDAAATACLMSYRWPGNVRELRNVVEHAALNAPSGVIGAAHLPDRIRASREDGDEGEADARSHTFRDMVETFERELISSALREADWNKSEVSRRLGIPPRTLTNKIRRYEIEPDES